MKQNWETQKKHGKKQQQRKWLQWKWDTRFKFFEAFGIWTKTNIGDINSSSSDEEEGAEYKVKRILSGVIVVQKQLLADILQSRCQACNLIKRRLQHKCFPTKFAKFLRAPFLQNTSTLVVASGSKRCKPMKTYTENLCCRERNDITERYF